MLKERNNTLNILNVPLLYQNISALKHFEFLTNFISFKFLTLKSPI